MFPPIDPAELAGYADESGKVPERHLRCRKITAELLRMWKELTVAEKSTYWSLASEERRLFKEANNAVANNADSKGVDSNNNSIKNASRWPKKVKVTIEKVKPGNTEKNKSESRKVVCIYVR